MTGDDIHVKAEVTPLGGQSQEVDLKDDGLGIPDEVGGDGVFSGFFVPSQDVEHTIKVSVEATKASGVSSSRLLPIDQKLPPSVSLDGWLQRETAPITNVISGADSFTVSFYTAPNTLP